MKTTGKTGASNSENTHDDLSRLDVNVELPIYEQDV